MMGVKERCFSPIPDDVSLEDLVPKDNFYRSLEEKLDLSFVRDLVRSLYAKGAGYRSTRSSSFDYNWSCFSKTYAARGS
jgi:hypothetical protein